MSTQILMPALSPTMTEGKLSRWLKHVGDEVRAGVDQRRVRDALRLGELRTELGRVPPVVDVEVRHPLRARLARPPVARRAGPLVPLRDESYARVALGELGYDGG